MFNLQRTIHQFGGMIKKTQRGEKERERDGGGERERDV